VTQLTHDHAAPSVEHSAHSRWSLRVVVFVAAALFVSFNRSELPIAWRSVRHADLTWLLVALCVGVLLLVNLAAVHDRGQRLLGVHRGFGRTLLLTLRCHFLNTVTKSGGMAGVAPFNADARRQGLSVTRSTAGYLLTELASHLGFTVALIVAVPVLTHDGKLSTVDVVAVTVFAVLTVAFVVAVIAASRSQQSIRALHALPNRLRNAIRAKLNRPLQPNSTDHRAADDLHEAVVTARRRVTGLMPLGAHCIAQQVMGTALLWVVLRSLGMGYDVNVALVAYAIATLFSIVGFLPAGLGFVEVSMAATLVSYGTPAGQAAAAVGVYRLFQLWLPLSTGALAMRTRPQSSEQLSVEPR
jgi:hypothetical protein